MKPLKILIFAGYYFPFRGGYVESIHGLVNRLVKKKYQVTIVTCNVYQSSLEEFIDGVRILRLPSWYALNKTYPIPKPTITFLRIIWDLWREKYDIISTQTRFFPTSFLGAFLAFIKRIPLIHTERGSCHSVVQSRFVDIASRLIDHTLGFFIVRVARQNIGVSKAACDFLKHIGAKHISRIPNGVKLISSLSNEEKRKLKEKWGFSSKDYILLFVGRLIYAKGLQDVLAIIPSLINEQPNLKLVIVGDGQYSTDLRKLQTNLHLGKKVRFLGLLQAAEVEECLQIADAFVNPSHSEGLPRSVLEAAAIGLPIVASDVGGTSEIILHKKTGLLFQPKDLKTLKAYLQKTLTDRLYANELGSAARKHLEANFTWKRIVQSYIDLFREVV